MIKKTVPRYDARRRREPGRIRVEIIEKNDSLDTCDGADDLGDMSATVEVLSAIAIAVDNEHQFRCCLREAIDDGFHSEFRRSRRPDGADGSGRQHRNDGFRNIRHISVSYTH